jgi:FkbM family methyltransferase
MATGSSKSGLIYRLSKFPIVHHAVSRLGVYQLANGLLERFPVIRRLPSGRMKIRINSIAGFALAEEMFSGQGYREAIALREVRTFVDLGCNIGWFPCFLAETQGGREFSGLMFDADPRVISHARWHLEANSLTNCDVIHGVVGVGEGALETSFFINPASTQSAVKAFGEKHPFPIKGRVQEARVPAFSVQSEWQKRYGNIPIDLLKIDIEGAELDFLRSEIEFIKKSARIIVCEWHNWHVKLEQILDFMTSHGFALVLVTEQDENGGVVILKNQQFSTVDQG